MRQRVLFAYPWDVAEAGAGAFAAAARNLGMNGAAVAASYHAGKFLRPKADSGLVWFPEDGAVYFDTTDKLFGDLKPLPASRPQHRRFWADLADSGLAVEGWTVLLHNSRLGMQRPDLCAHNAYGDTYVFSLCPAQPAVADYAVALSRAVSALPLSGLLLETPGWLPQAHGYHHEFAQVRGNQWLDGLLSLCFCPACQAGGAAVGIDMPRLQANVRQRVSAYLNDPAEASPEMAAGWWQADLLSLTGLAELIRWRCSVVTALVARIRAAVRADCRLSVIPSVARPTAGAWLEGSDLAGLAQAADAVAICAYEPTAARVLADAADSLRRIGGDPARLRVILRPGHPDLSPGELAAALDGLRGLGLEDLGFYNHGHLRQADLAALARCLKAFS